MEFAPVSRVPFGGTILMLGCGSVAQCTLPLLLRHVVRPDQVVVMDFVDNRERIVDEIAAGVRFVIDRVTPGNLGTILSAHVGAGDILLDLAWNVDCSTILSWCHDNGVRYLNTSVELWDAYTDADRQDPRERSLYVRHMAVRSQKSAWPTPGPSAVLEHGANPGLVSHFTKDALTTIGERVLREDRAGSGATNIERALGDRSYNTLAMHLGVKVIHVAERDTQISHRPKEVGEFVNTWSVEGLYEEGVAPAELGWGTHERRLPNGAYVHQYGPSNQLALASMGIDTKVRSWTPLGPIHGMVIRHGEAFTITDHLTVWDGDRPAYRPTVHYAYCPTDAAIASVHELRMNHLVMPPRERQRIMNDEITSGADAMGILVMGHAFRSWWTGSILNIDEARALVPRQSATTVQVAVSVMAATVWMIENPEEGVCVPDDLPHERILEIVKPYLGTYYSEPVDWSPLDDRRETALFERFNPPVIRADDPDETWQFTTFLV